METTLQSELDRQVKLGEIEVFTPEQIKNYVDEANSVILKSEGSKDAMFKEIADEVKSFKPVIVYDDNTLEKSIKMWRVAQVAWDEPTGDDISKARSGKYTNTPENRKLGRVGKHYGAEPQFKTSISDMSDEELKGVKDILQQLSSDEHNPATKQRLKDLIEEEARRGEHKDDKGTSYGHHENKDYE